MKNRLIISFLAFTCFCFSVKAQDLPIYNQFYFNPYLYNPAFVGLNSQFEANLTYRKQWADISDAPQVSAFDFQYATEGRVALGLSFQSESSVALVTNTGYLTFGYQVPLGQDHFIQFGLSAGVIQNNLDLQEIVNSSDQIILQDPAILNAVDNTMYLTSQFGINYTLRNLTIGVAFPKLLENDANSTESFNPPSLDEFKQFIISGSYRADIAPRFSVQPVGVFRYVDRDQFQAEATALVRYNDFMWVGAGYRYESGAIGHVGMNLLNGLQLGYSFEFSGVNSNSFGGGSHEIHLKWRLSKKKKEEVISQVEEEPEVVEEPIVEEEEVVTEEEEEPIEEVVEEEPPVREERVEPTPVTAEVEEVIEEPQEEITRKVSENDSGIAPGYYVIVGAFSSANNALRHQRDVKASNIDAEVTYNNKNGMHYVYVLKSDNPDEASRRRREIRQMSIFDFKNGWMLHVE